MMPKARFLRSALRVLSCLLGVAASLHAAPLNILLFSSDDMNFDSSGVYGGPIKDLTPNIDRLAAEGFRFEHAYTAVAVCQPARQSMLCGRYPHRNGSFGFLPLRPDVVTLNMRLHEAGYLISTFGKNKHHQPAEKFHADPANDEICRHPSKLAAATRDFLRRARAEGKPFFHNVNCYDPHRPFIGMRGPGDLAGGEAPSRWIKPEEITRVPGFLEDLPDIRRELAGYYTSVRRLDDALGAVLKVLAEEGFADNTLVLFWGGDHGMSFPFGKSNCYENSSRCALIFRWPGVTRAGAVDGKHLVSTIDFTPTLLDAAALPAIPGVDGRSFVPVLKGQTLPGWDKVYTSYNAAFGNRWFPMRCVRTRDRAYIWNPWSDGKREYGTENMAGLTWKAMVEAARESPAIESRTRLNLLRVPEEFYELGEDPAERRNLIAEPARGREIDALRADLLAMMRRTEDPLAEAFARRGDPAFVQAALDKLKAENRQPANAAPAGGKD
jgi:N-sulfoglucosamine sulfohydrolase